MAIYASMRHVDVWYATVDVSTMVALMRSDRVRRTARQACRRDHLRALDRLAENVDGAVRSATTRRWCCGSRPVRRRWRPSTA
jgi:hypothetical protein